MEFKIVINPELYARYYHYIFPLEIIIYSILFAIPGLLLPGLFAFEIYRSTGLLWLGLALGIGVFLFGVYGFFGNRKKTLGKNYEEKLMDAYHKKELNGKIIFSEETLQYSYEENEPRIKTYTSFRKLYSMKDVYILKSDREMFFIDKKSMTKEERQVFVKMVRDKMPYIKINFRGAEKE